MKSQTEELRSIRSLAFQVDISTMLEEAVQYVKFMQLQIKVLKIFFKILSSEKNCANNLRLYMLVLFFSS